MKISDLDMARLVDAVSDAIFPIVFEGVGDHTSPSELRERANLSSEVLGRIMGVLLCGDEVDQQVFDLIDRGVTHMKASHSKRFDELLGPGGTFSKRHEL